MPLFLSKSVTVVKQYERHLSALAMVVGFIFDSWAFGPLDHRVTHLVFIGYLLAAGTSIALQHYLESQPEEKRISPRIRNLLALGTQFALGALLSGFCVFYLRSAALIASWPYLLVLGAIFIGNEVFRQYHSRLTLSALMFFFSLFSYTILLVPVVLAKIGTIPFILAGLLAVGIFAAFLLSLTFIGAQRLKGALLPIMGGAVAIFLVINAFYFAGVLPPLPLALVDAGVYHAVRKTGSTYEARGEPESWRQLLGVSPLVHMAPGERLYLYSAVFVPVRMSTPIVHRWEWYDPALGSWVGQGNVQFTVSGGRDGGYRGYSIKSRPQPGKWRVDVSAADGRPMGRIKFEVVPVSAPIGLQTWRLE